MESIAQDWGERLQRREFYCSNNPIQGLFQEWLEGGLFCSHYASIAMQYAQKQSFLTSDHLVWNTRLMNIQLNTWYELLPGDEIPAIYLAVFLKSSYSFCELHTPLCLGLQRNDRQCRHRRLCVRKHHPAVACLKLSS